ncbi:hypothetical protein [Bacillus timonensis]|uniref:hypothetical protein n=1 Tax=Bacillus timonensis TaxID=1033734 RepID=UPI000287F8F9|nr:hypothetical protein [Bacillus timonensis]
MIKKNCIGILILFSFGLSFYVMTRNSLEATSFGPPEVLLFSIPLTMIIVNSNLLILPKMMKSKESYLRYKKGMENIFLALSLILTILHIGLILTVTGIEFNVILLVPLSVGIALITTANTLPRFRIDLHSSSDLTTSSHHIWNIVIRPFSFPLIIGGLLMLFCVLLPEHLILTGFLTILFCTLLISITLSFKAYKAHSNKIV